MCTICITGHEVDAAIHAMTAAVNPYFHSISSTLRVSSTDGVVWVSPACVSPGHPLAGLAVRLVLVHKNPRGACALANRMGGGKVTLVLVMSFALIQI
jgi:hypothetical protein